jgi:sarcosine oxidase subunit gamma
MANPEALALVASSHAEIAGLASVWPASSSALALRIVEPVHVLSLHHRGPAGAEALATVAAAQRLPRLPEPGHCHGMDPVLVWRSPSEVLLITEDGARAAPVLAALRPSAGATAFAVDRSHGTLTVELTGRALDALLARLVDASGVPRELGRACATRLADIPAVLWRTAADHMRLQVDRAHDHYLARWLAYAAERVA